MLDDVQVGIKLGLNHGLNLAQRCADFYVLESLEAQLTERHFWGADGRMTGPRFPVEFTADTRKEFLAISVQKSMQTLEEEMAREFVHYLSIACGGELRHLAGRRRRLPTHELACKHECGPTCCSHDCDTWGCSAENGSQSITDPEAVENCINCQHVHWTADSEECLFCEECANTDQICPSYKKGLEPDYGWSVPLEPPLDCICYCGHKHLDNCTAGLTGCSVQFCCIHKCGEQGTTSCWKKLTKKRCDVPTRVEKYLAEVWKSSNSRAGHRNYGWEIWQRMSKRTLAAWMYDCADGFAHPGWGLGSFGGAKWEVAARLTADYLSGIVTTRTYLDRCWSLQHNGGCIFNKFYPNLTQLMTVLCIQAANDYVALAGNHCSEYVGALWKEHMTALSRETRDWGWLDLVNKAHDKAHAEQKTMFGKFKVTKYWGSWPFQPNFGCECCAWYSYHKSPTSHCLAGGGNGTVNTECSKYKYYQNIMGELGVIV